MSDKITRKTSGKESGKGSGSGRTVGSFSFVILPLSALTSKFADPNQPITVGRKWAEVQGFNGLVTNPANVTAAKVESTTPSDSPAATVISLDE